MMRLLLVLIFLVTAEAISLQPLRLIISHKAVNQKNSRDRDVVAAVLPGSPLVTGTLSQGVMNALSLYSNVIIARVALSWFPQLPQQFPILRPIFTVTEPYLGFFRKQIPSIAGFDISIIPALFILDILGQTTAAVGAEIPEKLTPKTKSFRIHQTNRIYRSDVSNCRRSLD